MRSAADPCSYVVLKNVSKTFLDGDQKVHAVRDACLVASPGELIVLLGPSGSGKTTLLTLIAGLLSPTSGSLSLFGQSLTSYSNGDLQSMRAKRIGFIFQNFLLIDSIPVVENVAMVLRFSGRGRSDALARARELLDQFGIGYLARKLPSALSQGEKQRVAVARAIANNPELIIADEPTASLETNQGFDIIRLLHDYARQERRCVIVATHDLRIADLADRVLRVVDGRVRVQCPQDQAKEVYPGRPVA
ncbi:MAG: ABC transporter ATP-binding protein [bacterium]|nr:MAG: ABC transporter ATP-binding protein [bacterium]